LHTQEQLFQSSHHNLRKQLYGRVAVGIEAPRGMITKVKEIVMSILAWIVLGLIVGFIASKLVNKTGEGVLMNMAFGSAGAMSGGELINKFGMAGMPWLNLWSVLVSLGGAALFLVIYHALLGAPSRPTA
jgi:uncharacterized membrane protein YeaQ/YmgE (transglycosylase-associated protein family)